MADMNHDLDPAYARLADVLHADSDYSVEVRSALMNAGWEIRSELPEYIGDSVEDYVADDLWYRFDELMSIGWQGHMVGSGSRSLGILDLLPSAVWTVEIHHDDDVMKIYTLHEYASVEAASDALTLSVADLFFDMGPPDSMYLGLIENQRDWAWQFFMSNLKEPDSHDFMNWAEVANIVEQVAHKTLPLGTQQERERLLNAYLDVALS